ncbi:LANO_0F15170g1_1 [Lachancea nothofagi CBS 11611]|uniref:LANO_0F15170g1_1 n=1 Tax=Lachancea nothofagi CBS 11611 TaxID=1266666 RepID=A0A1G4KCM8_9SACH|nr:LANO_0F15170g1_1 [Lachancea nothofagi CBS 11611]
MGAISIVNRTLCLLFMAGTTLLLILIILSGSTTSFPVNRFYWLEADTSGITGAPDQSARWTFWGLCTRDSSSGDVTCPTLAPAYPISPRDNFGSAPASELPTSFVDSRATYYYLTRFSFCFFWVALAFMGVAFLLYVISWCSYAFTKVVFILAAVGALFDTAAVSCQTAATVMARNAFKHSNRSASLSATLMGIAWASVACSLIVFFGTGATFIRRAYQSHKEYVEMQKYKEQALMYQGKQEALQPDVESYPIRDGDAAAGVAPLGATTETQPETHHSGIKFFKIRRSQKPGDQESV